ncbi:uncharacterized protein LOC107849123 isoform X3 [Capsicum annuum]|uniref:uncharacterized protein LOC107849123 isoform X3 n=1 Tax=Capsicum annuum TaxID=4072 RepID=UPI001FB18956|nr:uncharacterized protein LOC107849123 isoform X3 [Capsicum annuum]
MSFPKWVSSTDFDFLFEISTDFVLQVKQNQPSDRFHSPNGFLKQGRFFIPSSFKLPISEQMLLLSKTICHQKCHRRHLMQLVDPFRPWMQGDHTMIMILMTFFDFAAFVLDIQL